jgi:hypothetical protein
MKAIPFASRIVQAACALANSLTPVVGFTQSPTPATALMLASNDETPDVSTRCLLATIQFIMDA